MKYLGVVIDHGKIILITFIRGFVVKCMDKVMIVLVAAK